MEKQIKEVKKMTITMGSEIKKILITNNKFTFDKVVCSNLDSFKKIKQSKKINPWIIVELVEKVFKNSSLKRDVIQIGDTEITTYYIEKGTVK